MSLSEESPLVHSEVNIPSIQQTIEYPSLSPQAHITQSSLASITATPHGMSFPQDMDSTQLLHTLLQCQIELKEKRHQEDVRRRLQQEEDKLRRRQQQEVKKLNQREEDRKQEEA